jgi:hypothetical protein
VIDAIRRAFRPIGHRRTAEADTLLHDIRTETQVVECERFLLQRERERERTWLEDALLLPPRREERKER